MTAKTRPPIEAWLLTLALVALVPAGCSSRPPAPAGGIWVTGEVTSEGKPLPFGVIQFFGKDSGASGSVRIQRGRFALWLKAGGYRVAVIAEETPGHEDERGGYVPAKSLIPEKFGDVATSKLEADVSEQQRHLRLALDG